MGNIKAINLDDETYHIWQKKFKGTQEFSSWIQNKLKEEKQKEDSPEVLRKDILELTSEIEKLNAQRALKQKKLQLRLEEEQYNAKAVIEEQERLSKLEKHNASEKLIQKVGYIIQYVLNIKYEETHRYRDISLDIAQKFALLNNQNIDLKDFVSQEVKNYA